EDTGIYYCTGHYGY
nr:immunoglobulin heavy chain junction region [Mus musculus]